MKRLDFIFQRYVLANAVIFIFCVLFWSIWGGQIKPIIIIGISCLFFVLLSIFIFRIHRSATRQLRAYFYRIYQKLEDFDVEAPTKIQFAPSPIQEFDELSQNLNELIDRLHHNYHANKQFTQNAAHELQTPLMIIKANAELLLQSPKLIEGEVEMIANILAASNRLSRLNSALILLSKIEHGRYTDTDNLLVKDTIEDILTNFKDLIKLQGLRIEKRYEADLKLEMSETLLEILIANLIQNAIRHNIEDGFIRIIIESTGFIIENSGNPLQQPPEKLFARFKRESDLDESLGLGLAIVKRICDFYDFKVIYECTAEHIHRLSIHKKSAQLLL